MLTVVAIVKGNGKWVKNLSCVCECGNPKVIGVGNINRTKSCGCLFRSMRTPEATASSWKYKELYETWRGIKQRCFNKKHSNYAHYGAKGVSVNPEWVNDFDSFNDYINSHLGPRPDGFSIDRINVSGDYEPGNIRWASPSDQAKNRRNNIWITAFGRTMVATDWARESGLTFTCIAYRIRAGWNPEIAVSMRARVLSRRKSPTPTPIAGN